MLLTYEKQINEVRQELYERIKKKRKGYEKIEYEMIGYRENENEKIEIMMNGETVDALSCITHRDKAHSRGRQLAAKMKELIPRQMFEVAIQAAIGNKVIARETLGALKKDVTAKWYGGDVTRKRKLWAKQKEGKKRMKQIGRVEVPQEAFLALLKVTGE